MSAKRGRPKTGRKPKSAAQRAREYRARQAAKMLTLAEAAHMADSAACVAERMERRNPLHRANRRSNHAAFAAGLVSRAASVLAEQAQPWWLPEGKRSELERLRARIQELTLENEMLRKRLKY